MSDELDTSIESLAEKLRQLELNPAEQDILAAVLGSTTDEVEGFGYDLNPNDLSFKAYDLNPNDLSFKLATSLGFTPRANTSDADIGPII